MATEQANLSTGTLSLMSILVAVNFGLAVLGAVIAYYVYFYIPHSLEVHYTSKYGEVVSNAATYIFVFPGFQVCVFVVSAIGRWGVNRPNSLGRPLSTENLSNV